MLTPFTQQHWNDQNGNPAGGTSFGPGFCISWQNGPLGRDQGRSEANGAFVETIIKAAQDRILYYQTSKFATEHNEAAIRYLGLALDALWQRTADREKRAVEGTHIV